MKPPSSMEASAALRRPFADDSPKRAEGLGGARGRGSEVARTLIRTSCLFSESHFHPLHWSPPETVISTNERPSTRRRRRGRGGPDGAVCGEGRIQEQGASAQMRCEVCAAPARPTRRACRVHAACVPGNSPRESGAHHRIHCSKVVRPEMERSGMLI